MLAPDLDLLDLDGRHLAGWLSLLRPPRLAGGSFALLFVEDDEPVHLVVSGEGAMPIDDVPERPTSRRALAELRQALDVDLVVALEPGAIVRLHHEVEGALEPGQDYAAGWIAALQALRRLNGRGVWCEPRVLDLLPPVGAEAMQRTFDVLVPDGSAMVAYCVEDDRQALAASFIGVKDGGDLTLVSTHLGLADALDERALARGWRDRYREVLGLVADRYAPPSIGVFFERAAFERVVSGPPDQLHHELSRRSIILDPMPPWLRALVGGAAVASAATSGARMLARFIPAPARRAAQDLASAARERLEDFGLSPFALLGFDPLELWRDVRHYYRR